MKHLIFAIVLFLIGYQIEAQSISKQVIGSSGQALTNNINTINFTVGEAIVGNVENGNAIHQGFWSKMVNDDTLSIETFVESSEDISVFPNPVVDILKIKFKVNSASNYTIELYNINGQQIIKLNPSFGGQIKQIDINHLPNAVYLLKISDKTSNYQKSIKIIKR